MDNQLMSKKDFKHFERIMDISIDRIKRQRKADNALILESDDYKNFTKNFLKTDPKAIELMEKGKAFREEMCGDDMQAYFNSSSWLGWSNYYEDAAIRLAKIARDKTYDPQLKKTDYYKIGEEIAADVLDQLGHNLEANAIKTVVDKFIG